MPLKKLCGRAGCNQIVDIGVTYCDKHQVEYEENQKQRHNQYKQQRDDKKEQAFYCSDAWLKTRGLSKTRYNGLCLWSYYILNRIVFCDVVHHIVELKEQWDLRLSVANLIPLSESIHQQIHQIYKQGKKEEVQKILRQLKKRWEEEQRDID